MSEEPRATHVIEALARVIRDLPAIGKDKQMTEGARYNYRGIEQITAELAALLAKHCVVIIPTGVRRWDREELTINGRPWHDDVISQQYRIFGPGGPTDFVDAEVPGIGRDNSDKGSNKAMTAAYKVLLTQALCITDGKDDPDNERHEADAAPVPEPVVIAESLAKAAVKKAKQAEIPDSTIQRFVRVATKHRTDVVGEVFTTEYDTFAALMKEELANVTPREEPANAG